MDYTLPKYSRNRIDKAGGLLLGPKAWTEGADIEDALEIINNHRSSHNYPLLHFRIELSRKARKVDSSATIAQRIKRLRSIEAKLTRFPKMRLSHMQDIGGCRAVVRSAGAVRMLANLYRKSKASHTRLRIKDYLTQPPPSGYRGIHFVYAFKSTKRPQYDGLKIEVQLRSRQQHAWATAVETVDVFTGQALKAARGTALWQRFFALVASHIALKEQCPTIPNTPTDPVELRDAIVNHVTDLDVFTHLASYQSVLQTLNIPDAHYYLLELDAEKLQTKVWGFKEKQIDQAQSAYLNIEKAIAGQREKDAVLVSAGSMESLKRAYPNYFADTHVFIRTVREAIGQ